MKNWIGKGLSLSLMVMVAGGMLTACDEETLSAILDVILNDDGTTIATNDGTYLGWLEEDEDNESIEDDLRLDTSDGDGTVKTDLPSKVDLTQYLPPVGNQGNYGTCVAWATAYNARTWLDARANGKTTSQLTTKEIYSPADIFRAIPSQYKGSNCEGSNFGPALNVMQTRGVASWSAVPYSSIASGSDCDCATSSADDADAAKHKIKGYREVDITNLTTLKRYLYEGSPIIFGASLGDNFMNASGKSVLTSRGTTNSTGMHAYHAMVIVGYDDSQGSNGAFRIVNSWGISWADYGLVWVDYKYFLNDFAYCGYVAYTEESESIAVDPSSTLDLMPTVTMDEDYDEADDPDSDDPTWRLLTYNIYNAGTGTVPASATWGNAYMLYNAYDANEYTIVLIDLYTDVYGSKGDMNGKWDKTEAKSMIGLEAQGYSWTNIDIPGQSSVVETIDPSSQVFEWPYKMPDVSGKYYLVMFADAFGSVGESNEQNNFYFLTTSNGGPLTISNGVIQSTIGNNKNKALALQTVKPKQNATMPCQTAVTPTAPNTYTPAEIAKLIQTAKENGELQKKALQWVEENGNNVKPRRVKKIAQ
ncbi:MAG: C1 family peptidase [Bacteroidales bacterium]|nr:C1 family peptidase [Bacteroidales bacterium]